MGVEEVSNVQYVPGLSTAVGQDADNADMPSIEELLLRIDNDIDANAEPEAPPSLEEMLANLDKDEQEEAEFEESLRERDRFFDLGNVVGTAIMKLTPDPFEDLTADNVSLAHKFSYAKLDAFGNMCLANARAKQKEVAMQDEG